MHRTNGGRGSVLMLMPAGLLVVLMLGAIAFDLSVLFLRQRQASSVAADLANDLTSAAFDDEVFRATGRFELDPALAADLGRTFAADSDVADSLVDLTVEVLADDAVRVTVAVEVDYVFAGVIPGAADGTTVTASATAVAAAG
jgi:hypothetical protein